MQPKAALEPLADRPCAAAVKPKNKELYRRDQGITWEKIHRRQLVMKPDEVIRKSPSTQLFSQ
jgi:hypothetical protein